MCPALSRKLPLVAFCGLVMPHLWSRAVPSAIRETGATKNLFSYASSSTPHLHYLVGRSFEVAKLRGLQACFSKHSPAAHFSTPHTAAVLRWHQNDSFSVKLLAKVKNCNVFYTKLQCFLYKICSFDLQPTATENVCKTETFLWSASPTIWAVCPQSAISPAISPHLLIQFFNGSYISDINQRHLSGSVRIGLTLF